MHQEQIVVAVTLACVLLAVVLLVAWSARHRRRVAIERAEFIARYRFPSELRRRIGAAHPEWTFAQIDRLLEGLREYFAACLSAQRGRAISRLLGMPSAGVDDAWHAFIVMTADYAAFCQRAFGRFLHHTPHTLIPEPMDDALANTLHQIRGRSLVGGAAGAALVGVPLLFALDRELGMPGGQVYGEGDLDRLEARGRHLAAMRSSGDAGGDGGSSDCGASGSGSCDAGSGCGGGGGCGGGCGGA